MELRSQKKYTAKRKGEVVQQQGGKRNRQRGEINGISYAHFIPECEVLYENGLGSMALYNGCTKNPGHLDFISVKDFKMEHLPPDCRSQAIMNFIRLMCIRHVKIKVSFTSKGRPNTYHDSKEPYPYAELKGSTRASRCATGFIRYVMDPPIRNSQCPCLMCQQSENPKMKYWEVVVITATHVVYDSKEAQKTIIECFYDSEDKSSVRYLYGLRIDDDDMEMNYQSDRCQVTCVTHDINLIAKLLKLQVKCRGKYNTLRALTCGVMISHPHGGIKKITVGNILHAKIPITPVFPSGEPHRFGKGTKYRLPKSSSQHPNGVSTLDFEAPLALEDGTTFTVLENAHYLCQVHKYDDGFWVVFPDGTEFSLPNGNKLVVPLGTEFYCKKINFYMTYQSMYYLTYDVPTCPGSSGAEVIHYDSMYTRSFLNHTGAQIGDGQGRSSLNICLR